MKSSTEKEADRFQNLDREFGRDVTGYSRQNRTGLQWPRRPALHAIRTKRLTMWPLTIHPEEFRILEQTQK